MQPGDVDRVLTLPSDKAIQRLAELGEDQWFERKSGRISARDLAVPIVAMANAEGGYVVVGIHAATVEGVAEGHRNALRQASVDFTLPGSAMRHPRARISRRLSGACRAGGPW